MNTLVASFDNREPAGSLKERFERSGIKAQVTDESLLQSLVFWTKPYAAKKVCVDDDQADRARALLMEWEKNEHVLADAIRCPECGSPRVEYPQYTRKFATPLLIEWLIGLGFSEKDYYCTDCHYTWPRKVKLEPEHDPLGFPKRTDKPRISTRH